MSRLKRTFEQADEGWTIEQAMASELGYDLAGNQQPQGNPGNQAGAARASSELDDAILGDADEYDEEVEEYEPSQDEADQPQSIQQPVQAGPPAKRTRRTRRPRRRRDDPPVDCARAMLQHMAKLNRNGQACDRCKIRKYTCRPGTESSCEACLKANELCCTTDRNTIRPIPRRYLETVEEYAGETYHQAVLLQNLLSGTRSYIGKLETHIHQLASIVMKAGLPLPAHPVEGPEEYSEVFNGLRNDELFAPIPRPPRAPPGWPSIRGGGYPGNPGEEPVDLRAMAEAAAAEDAADPSPAVENEQSHAQNAGTANPPPGSAAQESGRSVKRRKTERCKGKQRVATTVQNQAPQSAAPPHSGAPATVPSAAVHPQAGPHGAQRVAPTRRREAIQNALPGPSVSRGNQHANAGYNPGAPHSRTANCTGQQYSQAMHAETIDITGDDDANYLPQNLSNIPRATHGQSMHSSHSQPPSYPGVSHSNEHRPTEQSSGNYANNPSTSMQGSNSFLNHLGQSGDHPSARPLHGSQNLAADVHQSSREQAGPLPSQHGNFVIDPALLQPMWQYPEPVSLAPTAQSSTAQAPPGSNNQDIGELQPYPTSTLSSPLDFSVLDRVNLDNLPAAVFDGNLGPDIENARVQFEAAERTMLQQQQQQRQPVTEPPAAESSSQSVRIDPEIEEIVARYVAETPELWQLAQRLGSVPGSIAAEVARSDDADSLFNGSLPVGPSP
ncbi:hypothetical protein BDV59DRAFT_204060 [Aspergillus ambiguus]|uniref:uncharacterized protein n=1 Tax=Aspergillus ambiguus TaxID=176160 RepID=UPI003CCC9830